MARAYDWDIINLFDERPVPLLEFIQSPTYLNFPASDTAPRSLSDIQYAFVEHGTQIYRPETIRSMGWDEVPRVTELVALWGKGSGKDFCSQIIIARIFYLLMVLKSPHEYYGKGHNTFFDMLNCAFGAPQAKHNFFDPFAALVESSPWFRDHDLEPTANQLISVDKKVRAVSGHSFGGGLEGMNIIAAVLDEIAEFRTQQEVEMSGKRGLRMPKYSAEALYDMVRSSADSRFGADNVCKVMLLSFPRYKGDFIMTAYDKALTDIASYASKACTWEANPSVTKESLAVEYRRNPERAKARYECDPSIAEDSFYKDTPKIDAAFPIVPENATPIRYAETGFPKFWDNWHCAHNFLISIHGDLSKARDRAGFAGVHAYEVETLVTEDKSSHEKILVEVYKVAIDFICSFHSQPGEDIQFQDMERFVLSAREHGLKIGIISFDGFESTYISQNLVSAGFEVVYRSIDRTSKPHDDLKNYIYDERIIGGYCVEVVTVLGGQRVLRRIIVDELKGLVLVHGKKVDHRPSASKDEADALAGALQGALELGVFVAGGTATTQNTTQSSKSISERDEKGVSLPSFFGPPIPARLEHSKLPVNIGYRGLPGKGK